CGHGLTLEKLEPLQAPVQHPFGFAFTPRDVANHFVIEPPAGVRTRIIGVAPSEFVCLEFFQARVQFFDRTGLISRSHNDNISAVMVFGSAHVSAKCVEQAWSLRTIVASSWTCVSRTLAIISVSASHKCVNSSATW